MRKWTVHQQEKKTSTMPKSSVGMWLGCKVQKVLGLAWDYEADIISFDLTETAERAKGLLATKGNTLRLPAEIFVPLGIMGPDYSES